MSELLEILKYTLPSIVVFFTAYLIIQSFMSKEDKKRRYELNLNNQRVLTPIRLQAYERIVLFLERIAPDALILRIQPQGMTAREFQSIILATIRAEFEHNLSQQIYISPVAWESVKSAKESIVKLVNAASARFSDEATGMDLSKLIVEIYMTVDVSPVHQAIEIIKNEIEESFAI